MEPVKKDKRPVAAYLPYRKAAGEYAFYLQMRDSNTKRHPNVFSLFGGGIEAGETPEQALKREIMEEMEFTPKKYLYFSRYETATTVFHIFIEEVGESFESSVTIHEGEYGKFLSYMELEHPREVAPIARAVIENLLEFLTK